MHPSLCLNATRDQVRKVKAIIELDLDKATRKASIGTLVMKENLGTFQKETGDLITRDMEKVEVVNDFFPQSSPASAPVTPPKLQKRKAGTGRMKHHLL